MFKEMPFRMKFLISVCVLYAGAAFVDYSYTIKALATTAVIFYKIIPLLLFIFVLNVAVNKYLKIEFLNKHIGQKSRAVQALYAVGLGIIVSGAPYMLYPMLGDLKKKGLGDDFLATMLFNVNVKIPFIPVIIYYFGLSYTVVLSILIITFSVLNGYLVKRLVDYFNN
jgi:uncharacterized membrane protein YraQ (UPF0718 family)